MKLLVGIGNQLTCKMERSSVPFKNHTLFKNLKLCMHGRVHCLRFTLVLVGIFIALTLSYLASFTFPNANSNQDEKYAKPMTFREKSKLVTTSSGDGSGISSSHDTSLAAHKLLGGLLAPGFDEESCMSRYQSYLYHKTSSHKPSPYLVSKLRQYEDRHKTCGPYTKSFNQTLEKALNFLSHASRSTKKKGCKYIIWIGSGGLGNRIMSMASMFLYALLTDRILLVNQGSDMANLFCEPFPNTSWLLPVDFPLISQRILDRFRMQKVDGNISLTMFTFMNLVYDSDVDPDEQFYRDETQLFLQKIPWIALKSEQYFVPSFFLIQSFRQELEILFPDKETVFHHLGRYLFQPSNQVWGEIVRFYQAYMAKADERIGLQVRLFGPSDNFINQILVCTQKENLLPKVEDKKYMNPPHENQTSKAIVVVSLYSLYYEHIRNMYLMKPTVNGEVVGVYQPSHEEYQQFNDSRHNMKALADMYILSLSDVLVTCPWSTFGYVAQGLAGLKPWILSMPLRHVIPEPACQRAISMEPCFLVFPNYDPSSLGRHIKNCEDDKLGLKLVNKHHS